MIRSTTATRVHLFKFKGEDTIPTPQTTKAISLTTFTPNIYGSNDGMPNNEGDCDLWLKVGDEIIWESQSEKLLGVT